MKLGPSVSLEGDRGERGQWPAVHSQPDSSSPRPISAPAHAWTCVRGPPVQVPLGVQGWP